MKNRQEKLSRIQLLKINCIAENHKQDNENSNNNSILQHDKKAWYALIIINKSMLE